jgi:hypothetical protein
MKVSEVKTITKNCFESLEELISVLSNGEVTVYIIPDGYEDGIPVSFCGDFIYFRMKYSEIPKRISLDKLNYKQFYTLYTNITTY